MSTRGFISIKNNGKITGTYNHSDSYPTWLGVRAVEFIQQQDLEAVASKLTSIQVVDETGNPTAEQLADLKARGFWKDVGTGTDWYSALRNAQGDLAKYIDAGYITGFDVEAVIQRSDVFIEWGYVIDLDERKLTIYSLNEGGKPMVLEGHTSFDDILAPGFDAASVMEQIEYRD